MEQGNNEPSLRDAVRDAMQDAMRDQHQMMQQMQQMLQTMQAMMTRMEVQDRAQPIRLEERGEIDGGRERGFENLEAPPVRREQQRHDVGLPRYVDQPPYFENLNRWEAGFRVEIPEFKGHKEECHPPHVDDKYHGQTNISDLKGEPVEQPNVSDSSLEFKEQPRAKAVETHLKRPSSESNFSTNIITEDLPEKIGSGGLNHIARDRYANGNTGLDPVSAFNTYQREEGSADGLQDHGHLVGENDPTSTRKAGISDPCSTSSGVNLETHPNSGVSSLPSSVLKDDPSSLMIGLAASFPSPNGAKDTSRTHPQRQMAPPLSKQFYSHNGIEGELQAQMRNGRPRVDSRTRSQLLPRYWPRITDRGAASKWLPGLAKEGAQGSEDAWNQGRLHLVVAGTANKEDFSSSQIREQRMVIESLISIIPPQKDCVSCSFLLRLLRLANMLKVAPALVTELEKRVGMQLEQATMQDLLIPSYSKSETLYDVDLVQRLVEHFLVQEQTEPSSPGREPYPEKHEHDANARPSGPNAKARVARLLDSYLTEVSSDRNLSLTKFQVLAEALPDSARTCDDGLYRAVDSYIKAHPALTEYERKRLCRAMDSQKLSIDACMHATRNERLPLRVVFQVLFSEQVKVSNAIASSSLKESGESHYQPVFSTRKQLLEGTPQSFQEGWAAAKKDINMLKFDLESMKARYLELQNDMDSLQRQFEKMSSTKSSRSTVEIFQRMKKDRCQPSNETYTMMINLYGKANQSAMALKVFNEMKTEKCKPNICTYTALINAFAREGLCEKAEEKFEEMQEAGHEPDVYTYNALMEAYSRAGFPFGSAEIFSLMQHMGCEPDRASYNIMVDAFGRAGLHEDAQAMFEELKQQGVTPTMKSYMLLLSAYSKAGNIPKCEEIMNQIYKFGLKPDTFVLNSMLNAYGKVGRFEKMEEVLTAMEKVNLEHFEWPRIYISLSRKEKDELWMDESLVKDDFLDGDFLKDKVENVVDSIIITAMDANIPDGRHMENFECNENYCRSMQRNQGFNEDLSHTQSTKPAGNVQDTSNYVKESFVLKNQRAEDWFVVNRSDRLPEDQTSAEHTMYEDDQAQAIHDDHNYSMEKKEKKSLIDDSFVVPTRSMENEQQWSSRSTVEISSISLDKSQFSSASYAINNYRLLVEQLERVDVSVLESNAKLAFWVSIYNSLIIHAYLAFGIPHSSLRRIALFHKAAYNIGGHIITANSIEHSILSCRTPRISSDLMVSAGNVKAGDRDSKEGTTSEDDRSFTFEVGSLAEFSEKTTGNNWKPFSSMHPLERPQVSKENSSLRSSFSEEGVSDEDISLNQSLDVPVPAIQSPVPATQSQPATSGKPTPGSPRRSKRLQNKRA